MVFVLFVKKFIFSDVSPRLVLATGVKEVKKVDSGENIAPNIFCITKVIFLPLTTNPDFELNLLPCHKHHTQHPNR